MDSTSARRRFRSMVIFRAALCGAGLGLALAFAPAASPASLMTPAAIGKQARSPFVKSDAAPVALNRAAMASLRAADEMDFVLPSGQREVIVFDRIEDHGGGIRSSIGYLKDKGKDYRVIITTGPHGSFGSIRTADTSYRIVPGEGHDWLVDKEQEKLLSPPAIPREDDIRRVPPEEQITNASADSERSKAMSATGTGEPGVALVTPSPQAVVDLMIVYTNGLGSKLGANLMTRLYNLIAAANTAYADSEVAITVRLVNATMVNYSDATSNNAALDAISPGRPGFNAAFSGIETIRAAVGADLVALVRDGGDFSGSGVAWLATTSPTVNRLYSVSTGCVVGCDSLFIHEVGHNMGNAHDRATAAAQDGGTTTPSPGAYPYSFGYYFCANTALTCNPFVAGGCPTTLPQCAFPSDNDVGTIMSYFDPVTLKFSNPNVMCAPGSGNGISRPCGITELDANNSANNALSMNNMRFTLQDVKAQQIAALPGAVQFSATSFNGSESAGTVNVTVSRIGGSAGGISVNYATANGTAKSGFDYVTTTGTLTWANGDTADKTISIPLINDGVTEGGESFTVTLSSPSGATGVFLGNPVIATVLIGEAWPPGGMTIPPGFTPIGSPSGFWNVTSDRAFEGTVAMRSPQVINGQADLQYSAVFPAGTVSFAYQVSSYPNFGEFDFLVDNVAVLTSTGGETGWVFFSYQLAGGSHTLIWRYRNSLTFACGSPGVNPPPPAGTNCADRAWIDAVTLPITLSASSTALTSSANPSIAGQSITFTATVSGGAGTPAGVVTFRDGGVIIPGCNLVVMNSAVAQCTTSGLAQGARSITAAYSGNTTYDVSTSTTLIQTVNPSSFLLTVAKAGTGNGEVTSNPAGINTAIADNTETYNAGTPVTLTATPQGGSTFASWSGGGCSGSGGCVVTMNAATTVTATFNIVQTAPGAPIIGAATPGNGVATIAFTPPASDGGSPILDYTVTCNVGNFTATGPGSPLTVTGLTNTVGYTCSVTARNAIGTGPASGTVGVTPQAGAALALVAVQSRKTHTGIGPFDLPITTGIPINGLVSVEPRNIGAGHSIVFQFNNTVTVPGTVTAVDSVPAPIGNPTATVAGTELIVTLTGVPNGKRVTVTLTGVNSSFGTSASMGFLVGDVNGTRAVNASDISSVKRQVGQPVTAANFRFDLNATGAISATDLSVVKARSGTLLP